MAYNPTTWVEKATKVGPTNLNKLELGVQATAVVADAALPTPAGTNGQFLKRVGGLWVPTSFAASDIPSFPSDSTKVLRGDGTWGTAPSNKITTSTLAGGPPGSPSDGDIWIATAVDANGVRWAFQYNAGSASASKWEFIGGPSMVAEVLTSETTASATYAALATAGPSITLARAGDYDVTVQAEHNASVAANTVMSYDIGGTGAADADGIELTLPTGIFLYGSRTRRKSSIAAATALVSKYKTNAGTTTFRSRMMFVTPIRIA